MFKVLLAGGGTAGHINPALAIASIIKDHYPDTEFLFAGTPNGMEARLIPKAGYNFAAIKVSGFQRKLTPQNIARNIRSVAYLTTAGHRAKQIINDFKPDLVIGTGGYVSGPIVLKAAQMGIKTAIHEQNAYPGVTTRMLSKHVDEIMLTVEEAKKRLKQYRQEYIEFLSADDYKPADNFVIDSVSYEKDGGSQWRLGDFPTSCSISPITITAGWKNEVPKDSKEFVMNFGNYTRVALILKDEKGEYCRVAVYKNKEADKALYILENDIFVSVPEDIIFLKFFFEK